MATTIGNLITLDGQFTDWTAADDVMTPANTVAGYQVYGALLNDATLGDERGAAIEGIADFLIDHGIGQPEFRNLAAHHAAGLLIAVEDDHVIA